MGLWEIFSVTIPNNLGMAFETIILIIALFGGIIYASRDFKTAIIMYLMAFTCIFIWFYEKSLNYTKILVILLAMVVILALILWFSSQTEKTGSSLA